MENLAIRKAIPSDSKFGYSVKKAAFREYVEKVWGWDEDEQRQLHERRYKCQDFRIISIDGTDVGIMATVEASDCLKLKQLLILPERQGKGIGSDCMSLIIDEVNRLGLLLRLRVIKVNQRALAFYQRLGFACISDTDTHFLIERANRIR